MLAAVLGTAFLTLAPAAPAQAQRIAIPASALAPAAATPPVATLAQAGTSYVQPGAEAAAPGAVTPGAQTPASPYTSPYAPPSYAPPSPYAANGPTATLEGSIGPPPPNWDPYATPEAQAPGILPETPAYGDFPHQTMPAASPGHRLLQEYGVDYLWISGTNGELGINNIELSATMAFPFLWNAQQPLLVTPGFGVWYWNGPISPNDLPPQTYDTYLDLAWNPQATSWLGGELNFRVGVYSDFRKITHEAIRLEGKGMAVLTLNQRWQAKFGVWYLDRNRVKVLPAGGLIWTPNADVRFEILFPNPKLAQRLTTWGTTNLWWYVAGYYGGGAWEFTRDPASDPLAGAFRDRFDYNDIEISLGVEFDALSHLEGYFEAGLAFEREVFYVSRNPNSFFYPEIAFMLRAGLSY